MAQTQTQPRPIPSAGLKLSPPPNLAPPTSLNTLRSPNLTLDALSPVTQKGCFEFDRILKSGEVLKRTRKTKSWKPIYLVLRPNLLSIYRNKDETNLRHQINLSELTAVARQKDPKRKNKYVFGLFSPSRNYHIEAKTEKDAQEWVELVRKEARMDDDREELVLASPGGAKSKYEGFERILDRELAQQARDRGYSSSEAEMPAPLGSLPKTRDRGHYAKVSPRRPSHTMDYSGAEGAGSYSDFSDSGVGASAARMSALSLAASDGRPSTSGPNPQMHSIYGATPQRPGMSNRTASQMSNLGLNSAPGRTTSEQDNERVVYHGWIFLLKSHKGVRQWKKVWMVLRPRALALYKNEEEYSALLIIAFSNIIDAVDIDPISRSKPHCMQIISEERNFRFCCTSEESLTRWLGAFKSLLSKRKVREKEKEGPVQAQ